VKGKLGIIGAGCIAEALINGLTSGGKFLPRDIYVINRKNNDRLKYISEKYGVNTSKSYKKIADQCKVLIIAVKPNDVSCALTAINNFVKEDHVIISVAAGISTEFVENKLSKKAQVVRVMPNTSCQIKESATAIATGRFAGHFALDVARDIFSTVGKVFVVEEELLDVVTGLSGSGPAYVYLMMEALMEAGVNSGLDRSVSEQLAIQTVFGAAKMALESGENVIHLRKQVTTPGGTTLAALQTLNAMGFTATIVEAAKKAAQRSRDMLLENMEAVKN
jgi:pyrroline-5-carboxylate reductase